MDLVRGQKVKLDDITVNGQCTVTVTVTGVETDVACFGLDAAGKLSDDRYMVFFNQTASPAGEVTLTAHGAATTFQVNVAALPATIERLSITAASDDRSLSGLQASSVTVTGPAGTATFAFAGADFTQERAVMLLDLYRKDGIWRVGAVGQGFNEGLGALVRHFGGSVADEPAAAIPAPAPAPASSSPAPAATAPPGGATVDLGKRDRQVSLEKQMAQSAPGLLSLAKRAAVSLDKHGLGTHTAKVALVLDISASMSKLYRSGQVQAIAERILALGTRFDDDGEIDLFLFGQKAHHAGGMRIDNHDQFVDRLLKKHKLEGGTMYGKAIKVVREFYFGSSGKRDRPYPQQMPVYVMFVTDGATGDESETLKQITAASYEPMFWQFLGIGESSHTPGAKKKGFLKSLLQSDFSFLEKLDNMDGRYIDNADFFAVADPAAISDDELYDLLMNEYPGWLTLARQRGLLT